MNLNGRWTGSILYDEKYQQPGLTFEMELDHEGHEFYGLSIDTLGPCAHPEAAEVTGKIKGSEICFLKQYSCPHYFDWKSNVILDRYKQGPTIKYTGEIDEKYGVAFGRWELEAKWLILGLIPYRIKTAGSWRMRRKGTHEIFSDFFARRLEY